MRGKGAGAPMRSPASRQPEPGSSSATAASLSCAKRPSASMTANASGADAATCAQSTSGDPTPFFVGVADPRPGIRPPCDPRRPAASMPRSAAARHPAAGEAGRSASCVSDDLGRRADPDRSLRSVGTPGGVPSLVPVGHRIDLGRLTAIDVHTHVLASVTEEERSGTDAAALAGTFGEIPELTVPELAAYYRERQMAAVVFTVDNVTRTGREPRVSNEEIAEQAARFPDTLIPFASVDPGRGAAAVRIARRLIEDHGVRGFKFHPSDQEFYPNDRAVYPL